jgi:magnesium chelatase subunit D
MNPEEGELRPQLLDRFGLSVEVVGTTNAAERVEVVRRRLAFDGDPHAFGARFASDEAVVAERVAAARRRLDGVVLGDRSLLLIAGICARLGVDGLRADIVTARTARALAALDGAPEVDEEHVRRAALLALAHRRRRGPLDPPGLSDGELDDALEQARVEADGGGDGEGPDDDKPAGGGGPGGADGGGDGDGADAEAAEPAPPQAPAAERRERTGAATTPPELRLAGTGRGEAGRRSASAGRSGQPIDARPAAGAPVADLAVVASLRAAARRRVRDPRPGLRAEDLHEHVRAGREGNLIVFCVDASGSMGARRRMAAVKGAVLGMLLDAYRRRDRVALVTFRGTGAELVLPPTGRVEQAAARLEELATGGGTPLAAGLQRAAALIRAEALRDADRRALALVVTDGRASGGRDGRAAAARAAADLARAAAQVVVFDAEEGPVRLGLAGELARAAGARLLPLTALHPERSRRAA